MARHIWVSTDGDWNNTNSWHDNTVPVSGDIVEITDASAQPIISGLDQSLVNNLTILCRGYRGYIGLDAANPLKTGTGTVLIVDGPDMSKAYIQPSGGKAKVYRTKLGTDALVLLGTFSDVDLISQSAVKLGTGVNITNLRSYSSAVNLFAQSGAVLNDVYWRAGNAIDEAGLAAGGELRIISGAWQAVGDGKTYPVVMLADERAAFYLDGDGATVSSALIYAGTLDASREPTPKVITAGEVWPGGFVDIANGGNNVTGGITLRGGRIRGVHSGFTVTYEIEELNLPGTQQGL